MSILPHKQTASRKAQKQCVIKNKNLLAQLPLFIITVKS